MGWSESYWEDVRADWARLQAERLPAGEDETLDQQAPSRPAEALQTRMAAVTDLADPSFPGD